MNRSRVRERLWRMPGQGQGQMEAAEAGRTLTSPARWRVRSAYAVTFLRDHDQDGGGIKGPSHLATCFASSRPVMTCAGRTCNSLTGLLSRCRSVAQNGAVAEGINGVGEACPTDQGQNTHPNAERPRRDDAFGRARFGHGEF